MPLPSPFPKYAKFMKEKGLTHVNWFFKTPQQARENCRRGEQWVRKGNRPYRFRLSGNRVTMYRLESDPGPNRWHFEKSVADGGGIAEYRFDTREKLEKCRFAAYGWRRYRKNGASIVTDGTSLKISLPPAIS